MRPLAINSSALSNSPLSVFFSRGGAARLFSPRRVRASVKLGFFGFLAGGACRCDGRGTGKMGAARVAVNSVIHLTEKEERIFQQLLGVVRHFQMETQLRVAGGWVRDKVGWRRVFCSVAFDFSPSFHLQPSLLCIAVVFFVGFDIICALLIFYPASFLPVNCFLTWECVSSLTFYIYRRLTMI